MDNIGKKLIIAPERIALRAKALAESIENEFSFEPLICVCVLSGASIFFAELIKNFTRKDVYLDFIRLKSYTGKRSGDIQILSDIATDVKGKNVLIVEDIVDSGKTIDFLKKHFCGCKQLNTATLLIRSGSKACADYVGFTIDTKAFVVGYGMDYNEQYRTLNGVYEL